MASTFYVTVKDGTRIDVLAGPFGWRLDALVMLKPARRKVCELIPFSAFYAYGCTEFPNGDITRPGKINDQLGLRMVDGICVR